MEQQTTYKQELEIALIETDRVSRAKARAAKRYLAKNIGCVCCGEKGHKVFGYFHSYFEIAHTPDGSESKKREPANCDSLKTFMFEAKLSIVLCRGCHSYDTHEDFPWSEVLASKQFAKYRYFFNKLKHESGI